ncbi:FAD-dependent oxidoreductase [Parapedobacter sp.]
MEPQKHTDVLIIGAGLSGLMVAAQLLRYGMQPTVIDAKPGPDREAEAMLVSARSMELFRQLGLSDQLLAKGQSYYALQLSAHGTVAATLDFSPLAATDIAFPFIQQVAKDDMERILLNRLTERACPVAWETRLESLRQNDAGATATLVHHGKRQDWQCAWVIGADGQYSTLRGQLDIPLEGDDRMRNFFVADVETNKGNNRRIALALHNNGPLATIPFGAANRYRIVGRLPQAYNSGRSDTIRYTDIRKEVEAALGFDLPGEQCHRITSFRYRQTIVEQVRRQRCFLIGDAAHGVSPILNRDMNEGLYDAANLGWKLAATVNGRLAPSVLHTYQRERMPAVKAGKGIFGMEEAGVRWPGWFGGMRLMRQASRASSDRGRLQRTFERLSGLDVNYRHSSLSVHHASGGKIQAGDRFPCLPVFDEKSKTQTDLHRWCEKPGFVLLVLGTVSPHHLNIMGQWMRQKYPREMHLYYLPYSDRNEGVFQAFEVRPTNTKITLIRPDMYIGYINDMLNVSLIDTYMEEILGWAQVS